MYITLSKNMLRKARQEGYAVPAFSVHNLELTQVGGETAVQHRFSVILAATPGIYQSGVGGNLIMIAKAHELSNEQYMSPEAEVEFIKQMQIDSLAIDIDTAHGLYTSAPRLDAKRSEQSRKYGDIPLALHRAADLTPQDVQKCIQRDICKVNPAAELKIVLPDALKYRFDENHNSALYAIYQKRNERSCLTNY